MGHFDFPKNKQRCHIINNLLFLELRQCFGHPTSVVVKRTHFDRIGHWAACEVVWLWSCCVVTLVFLWSSATYWLDDHGSDRRFFLKDCTRLLKIHFLGGFIIGVDSLYCNFCLTCERSAHARLHHRTRPSNSVSADLV